MPVHVWGASGYAAAEAIRLLHAHPALRLGILESRSHAGQRAGDHFPLLRNTPYVFAAQGELERHVQAGDIVITAGGHGEARGIVPQLLSAGARVVDLSADYRFDDSVVYGLPELNADAIREASLIANPGCYPTATLLALLPLLSFDPANLIVDAKSGITGAGRNPQTGSLFAEVAGDIRSYGLNGHRHQPEIERVLSTRGVNGKLVFTPHVVPISRGMLVDAYATFAQPLDAEAVLAQYHAAYANSPFVRIVTGETAPSVAAVVHTNDAELRIDVRGNVVRAICAIDNLGKGAAGQAVQNINIMLGYPEETGFHASPVVA